MEIPEIDVAEIDVDELARRRPGGVTLVDVRQPDEYGEAHVPGAVLIPLAEVPERLAEIPGGGTVHLICGSGGRSRKAAQVLAGHGYDVVNVAGGTKGWIEAGHPVATAPETG